MAAYEDQNSSQPTAGSGGAVPVDLAAVRKRRFVTRLYDAHFHDLVRWLARRYGAGPPEPEDIAQAAFARIAALKTVEHIQNPRAFLFTIAVNEALAGIDWIRRTRRFVEDALGDAGEKLEEITPERIYASKDRLDAVLASVKGLSAKQRELLRRSRIEGQTYAEISADTGWSAADISRQLAAAMDKLLAALKTYDDNAEFDE